MNLYENGNYCLYLRKSRADQELEKQGEEETLARHERILCDLAKRLRITISAIYREVVSGETISARPVMQQLLHEVEQGMWDGVLVVEVERLARGDSIDQGTVTRAFQLSDTKIITPAKIYDPQNEFDEEYFEFGLFMSRREYKTIKRRLNAGRIASVKEGKYAAHSAPYGYTRKKLEHEKGFTLVPHPEQAHVVRLIFDWYAHGCDGEKMGMAKIAWKLNDLHIPSAKNELWGPPSISRLLKNPVYIGFVRWNFRKSVKKVVNGQIVIQRPVSKDYLLCEGRHPAIVDRDLFEEVQQILSKNSPPPVNANCVVRNPLSGLVFCKKCRHAMIRRPYSKKVYTDTLICTQHDCSTVASPLWLVEKAIIDELSAIIEGYELSDCLEEPVDASLSAKEHILKDKMRELEQLNLQKSRLYDFLEQGVYTAEVFLERSEDLKKRLIDAEKAVQDLNGQLENDRLLLSRRDAFIPKCRNLLEHYFEWDPATRNDVLKELVERIDYEKNKKNRKGHANDITFSLDIYPKIL